MPVQPTPSEGSGVTPGATTSDSQRVWTPRLVLGLVSIVLLLEVLAISYLMISTALPFIVTHYQTTQGAWLLTAFLLTGAVTAPVIGRLSDMFGKRRLLLVCVALAAVGCLLSAIAPSYGVMIAGRALAGFLVPCLFLGYSLIRDVFPPKAVALAVSIATTGMGLVAVPAPFLTGWLIDDFGFRSIFWFLFAVVVAIGFAILVTVDESPLRVRTTVDLVGAVLLGAGLAGVLVGVSFGPSWGWTAASTLTYLLGGAALLMAWLVSARTVAAPLVDLDVLRRRPVYLTTISAGVAYGISGLFAVLLPMMVMVPGIMGLGYGWGLSAEDFALFQLPMVIAIVAGGLFVGVLVSRGFAPRLLMLAGLSLMAIGMLVVAFNHSEKSTIILGAVILGLGQGMSYAAVPNLVIEAVSPTLQASTASIVAVSQSIFPAVLSVVAFTVLNNSHVAMVAEGATFYDSDGFKVAFVIGAIVSVVGALTALAMPRRASDEIIETTGVLGAA
ncbi:MFS transporter [Gordonia sp. SL306]|uniref:MFS transporter n=1 Tax=Gordonia sp. SL306 TaxID=2995145 RepID=UPI00226D74A9|nr:MFS transporter [Gordonia sp. SL306]WAC53981.1 MFS transporter [Gordonia sp. SL306]